MKKLSLSSGKLRQEGYGRAILKRLMLFGLLSVIFYLSVLAYALWARRGGSWKRTGRLLWD